ncbi:hypothetical protein C4J93_2052 [Pseudomonas sp. R2-37-08W]|uniref:hypothetical protein n=1 Tax=unclassified Pseudomonas TaxID=196821 RepID=UPI000F56DB98|nr:MULTISPECIES: hypothetical protein [unclassified Pseudomonas]AZF10250.1 hypothetical protein C4J93_2052 [Pseudomonas sp. R2-37-08W]AZF20756.1 hypothetical protein C4J91_2006 [Pseudomonas sp. R3-52-08]
MTRIKWYKFSSSLDAETLNSKINKRKFNQYSSDGFQISSFRKDRIEARYIERIEYDESQKDPFGETITTRRIVYRDTQFKIFFSSNTLEIINPGRNLNTFIMKLGEASGFNFSIEPISLDIRKLTYTNNFLASNFQNTSISISQIDLGEGTSAKITATGGLNIKETVEQLIAGRAYYISALTFKSTTRDFVASFVITRDGGLKTAGKDSNRLIEFLKSEIFII